MLYLRCTFSYLDKGDHVLLYAFYPLKKSFAKRLGQAMGTDNNSVVVELFGEKIYKSLHFAYNTSLLKQPFTRILTLVQNTSGNFENSAVLKINGIKTTLIT